jgi:hypothetical protein
MFQLSLLSHLHVVTSGYFSVEYPRVTTCRWLKKESGNMQLSYFKYNLDVYFIQ